MALFDRDWQVAWYIIWRRRALERQYVAPEPVAPEVAPLFVIDTSGLDWLIAEFDRLEAQAAEQAAPPRRDPRTGRWRR